MKSSADNPRVLIIGYGNRLRGDDGLGCVAAERLDERLPRTQAEVLICHQLTPDLAGPLSRAKLAIFIDASACASPGEITRLDLCESNTKGEIVNHHAAPEQLLALSQQVFGNAPQAYLFSMGGQTWDYSESLSPTVLAAMPGLIRQVEELLAEKGSSCTNFR